MTKQQLMEVADKLHVNIFKSWTKEKIHQAIYNDLSDKIQLVLKVIEHHTKFSKSYFWTSPSIASSRRSMENFNTWNATIRIGQDNYHYSSDVSCSCRIVYYTGNFCHNGTKKDVRLFKVLYNKLLDLRQTFMICGHKKTS